MSVNTTALSGHLADNAVLRMTKSGTPVLNFTVAVNESVKQDDGTYADRPSFIDCVLFGKRAAALEHQLGRGALVMVQGKLRQSTYEDKQGVKRSKVEVIVDELEWRQPFNA
ncbi:single-stranded DNA-binding protein [Candidatus Collinsella stercoripullorum]|uniref:single-stranded DNA-binding protein n=1 Tax=Candidatus Collinsella stercoripullorum TaxID=2838522 RepID=UPI0022E1D457|nr:single-stranded DNA-binding protein [Candidatus Collinsella stercoripullorum]